VNAAGKEPHVPVTSSAVTISAVSVLAAGLVILAAHPLGPLSTHMALHIALMNIAAPLLAVLCARRNGANPARLWLIAAIQTIALWSMHAPPLQHRLMESPALNGSAHALIFLVAFLFWSALLRLAPPNRWHAIPVLMLSGKLFCLLGVLLIFAPRPLFVVAVAGHATHAAAGPAALADQQLAGLLMIAACPLSYLVAAVVITVQFVNRDHAAAMGLLRRPARGTA
jgi:putative membrane protein